MEVSPKHAVLEACLKISHDRSLLPEEQTSKHVLNEQLPEGPRLQIMSTWLQLYYTFPMYILRVPSY